MVRAKVKTRTYEKFIPGTTRTGVKQRSQIVSSRRPPVVPVIGELKFHDIDVDQAAADLSGGIILNAGTINIIAQGVTESQRIGRKVTIKNIGWRGLLNLTVTATTTLSAPQTVRLMMVLDKQCNGATATVLGVLESANYQSFNNLSNKGRFLTMCDKTIVLQPQNGAGNGTANDNSAVQEIFEFYKKVEIPIEYDSTTGAITEIRSNNLFILIISDTATSTCTLDSKIRLRFFG